MRVFLETVSVYHRTALERWPLLAGGVGFALFAALLAGLLPALRASRLDPIDALKSAGPRSSAGRNERRMLRAVTMTQTAMTLALLVGAGLLIRTMHNLANVQTGYSTDRILTPFDQRRAARVVQGFGGGEPIAVVQARD